MLEHERFARLRLLVGADGLAALRDATVAVLGLGGVGSSCAEALARGGVGSLILLDEDIVQESNINRQALAFVSTLGRPKTEIMAKMVADINPDCRTHTIQTFLSPDNIDATLDCDALPRPDYVIDCIDTATQKLGIAKWCATRRVPLLSAMGAANKLDPHHLQLADIFQTKSCPMSRKIRTMCRHRGISDLEVLYTDEPTTKARRIGSRISGEPLGSMSYMPPIMGQMLAGTVIRRLAGFEAPGHAPCWDGTPFQVPRAEN